MKKEYTVTFIVAAVALVIIYIVYKNRKYVGQTIQRYTGINPLTDYSMPLGIRDNNPLNIRHEDAIKWQGEIKEPLEKNGDFAVFSSIDLGIRASLKNLQSYITTDKIDTVEAIINKWAPPEDGNNVDAYIGTVISKMGSSFSPSSVVTKSDLPLLAWSMSNVEVGSKYAPSLDVFKSVYNKYL